VPAIRRALTRERFDVLHVHEPMTPAICTGPTNDDSILCSRPAPYCHPKEKDGRLCDAHRKQWERDGKLRPIRSGTPLVRLPGTSLKVTKATKKRVVVEARRKDRPVAETTREILEAWADANPA